MKKNLFIELESKMVQKEQVDFKISEDCTATFVVDKKFLNTKVSEMLFEYADMIAYTKDTDSLTEALSVINVLLVKYFVRQFEGGKEVEIFKTEKTAKSNFETLVATGSAIANIENVDGKSLLVVLMSKFNENADGMKDIERKIKEISQNFVANKDDILKMVEAINKVGEGNETV